MIHAPTRARALQVWTSNSLFRLTGPPTSRPAGELDGHARRLPAVTAPLPGKRLTGGLVPAVQGADPCPRGILQARTRRRS
ncbi:MAG: hypothetical protein ACXVXJ_10415, partial [Mycobacteriaceae bacterium]